MEARQIVNNKRGIVPLVFGVVASIVIVFSLLIGITISSKFKWIVIGLAILIFTGWLIGQIVKNPKRPSRAVIGFVFLLIVLGLFFIIGAGTLQQSSFGGQRYVEIPAFATIQCDQLGSAKTSTIDISKDGEWISDQFPKNTNEWSIRINTPDRGFAFGAAASRVEYYLCNSRNFNTCSRVTKEVKTGGDSISLGTISSERHIWVQYQKSGIGTGFSWKAEDGAKAEITYKPFQLTLNDPFRGGKQELDIGFGCEIPTNEIAWKKRITQYKGTDNSVTTWTGNNKLQPGQFFNYITTNIIGIRDGNTQSGGWCTFENGNANVYAIETIKTGDGTTYNRVNYDKFIKRDECCEGQTLPNGQICQDGNLIDVKQKQCTTRADCGSLEFNPVLGEDKLVQRAQCVNNQCIFEQKEVECTEDTDCGTNEFCSRNTFTCKRASDTKLPSTNRSGGTGSEPQCTSILQEPFTEERRDCGFLGWKKAVPFVSCEQYTESGCRTSAWVYYVILGVILVGGFSVIMFTPKRKRRKYNG